MPLTELYLPVAVALGVGFLIGLQREHSARQPSEKGKAPLAGVRTYPLVALLGALSVLVGRTIGFWIVGAAFLAILIPVAIAYAKDIRSEGDRGITSEVALL